MKKLLILCAMFVVCAVSAPAQDISKLDKNFAQTKVDGKTVVWHNALKEPFSVEGFPFRANSDSPLRRIPESVKPTDISRGVYGLANHTAGGVIRFATDAKVVALRARISKLDTNMGHMPSTGASGFDVWVNGSKHIKTVNPCHWKMKISDPVEALISQGGGMKEFAVYMPLYNGVNSIEIGLSPNAKLRASKPHKIAKPIVFYGSSITQGACASRPSTTYSALLARAVDAPLINMGFSGNAKGETAMANLLSRLDASAFVYDYDHNAPNAKHLEKTHEPFFKIIRAAHPNMPIIIISRVYGATDERTNVIKRTYENAVKNGDKKVWFIDGRDLFAEIDPNILTVDRCHPNDTGFYLMYKGTLPVLKEALGIK